VSSRPVYATQLTLELAKETIQGMPKGLVDAVNNLGAVWMGIQEKVKVFGRGAFPRGFLTTQHALGKLLTGAQDGVYLIPGNDHWSIGDWLTLGVFVLGLEKLPEGVSASPVESSQSTNHQSITRAPPPAPLVEGGELKVIHAAGRFRRKETHTPSDHSPSDPIPA
jgi:hypothetical protein